ncbi:tRNA (adenosine(37)-N6)-dimethylallyltransferase MiaA [Candidatus Dojkabacteria bacterium]|nr:tRNA (adenosine(37)-N6)-dimethylallyltransferase MiaA [Candidatus Dojkabacteria bacterium]
MKLEETSAKISDFLGDYKPSASSKYPTPIIVIAGPTASGKSALALELARKFNGYIINADSRQVYRELKIGTAQPQPDKISDEGVWFINDIEHFLYGHISIFDEYDLFQYQADVKKILENKATSNPEQIPFLVGGTGLYIDSIVYNYHLSPKSSDQDVDFSRAELEAMPKSKLQSIIGKNLSKLNPSDRENPHRLIRFIERGMKNPSKGPKLDHLYLIIRPSKLELETRIVKRIAMMFRSGLVDENIKLRRLLGKRNINSPEDFPIAMDTIGYKEFNVFLDDINSASHLDRKAIKAVKGDILSNSMQYVKRQLTWWRGL